MHENKCPCANKTDGHTNSLKNNKRSEKTAEFPIKGHKKRIVKINRLVGKVKKHVYVNFYIEIQKFMRSQRNKNLNNKKKKRNKILTQKNTENGRCR